MLLPIFKRTLTVSELQRLLAELPDESRFLAQLQYGSGMRIGELVALRTKDVDLDRAQITVRSGKGDKDRVTMFPQNLRKPMELILAQNHACTKRIVLTRFQVLLCPMHWTGRCRKRELNGRGFGYFQGENSRPIPKQGFEGDIMYTGKVTGGKSGRRQREVESPNE